MSDKETVRQAAKNAFIRVNDLMVKMLHSGGNKNKMMVLAESFEEATSCFEGLVLDVADITSDDLVSFAASRSPSILLKMATSENPNSLSDRIEVDEMMKAGEEADNAVDVEPNVSSENRGNQEDPDDYEPDSYQTPSL